MFRFPDHFFYAIFFEIISLSLHACIGILFLRLFFRLPKVLEITAGVFTGIGLSNFFLVIAAIFFLLNSFSAWLVTICLLFVLVYLNYVYGMKKEGPDFTAEPFQDSYSSWLYAGAYACLALITIFSFYHALFFPVDYWDSLIYYVHYGKMTYQQGGFPILYCLQVGLGLGANYPHLFPLHQAVTATMFGWWSDLYGQMLCPLAGLGCTIVVYYLALNLFKNRLVAITTALAFRTVPFVTSYIIWASDYALVMVYTALFLFFIAWFLEKKTWWSLQPVLCISAIFPHINYLGWIVWPCVVLAIWFARGQLFSHRNQFVPAVISLVFWLILGLIWYVRNQIVTGNPVYAFFPELFGGKNINLDVLKSCEQEWLAHGNGVAQLGDSIWERLINSAAVFIRDWRVAPILMGIMVPALLLGWKKDQKFFYVSGLLVFLYLFYQYAISGFYLYHIIAVFPILGLFVGRFIASIRNHRILFYLFAAMIIAAGVVPGISYSIMSPKTSSPLLPVFAFPGLDRFTFYRYRFPDVAPLWIYINKELEEGAGILTHDNRYHVFRDDLKIMHLDDCNLVPLYDKPYPQIHNYLLSQGISYYFFIPDEFTHPITQNLGHRDYLNNADYFELVSSTDSAELYRLVKGDG